MNTQTKNNKSGAGDQSEKPKSDSTSKKNPQNEKGSEMDFEQGDSAKKNKNAPTDKGKTATQSPTKKF